MAEGNRYALIIGNSQYNDKTLRQLATPQLDAQALADVLRNPAIGAFNKVEIFLDKENHYLRREIERFFARSERDDTLLLYFSGHGIRDELSGELYLATIDTEHEYLDSTAVPAEFIRRVIQKSRAERKILIFDSCFSGAVTNEMLAKGEANVAVCQQFGRGVVILTASTALQRAFQGDTIKELRKGGQSVFTRFLVEGLKTGEAAQGDNPLITISDLFHYAERQVKRAQAGQTPQITMIDQQGDIIIANSVKPRRVTLPEGILRHLKSPYPTDLMVAISDLVKLAEQGDKILTELAIQELQKLSLHSSVMVQDAAKGALKEVGRTPLETSAPLKQGVWAYLLSHPAIFISNVVLVVLLLVGGLSYPTLVARLNSPSTPNSNLTATVASTATIQVAKESPSAAPAPSPTVTPDVQATDTAIAEMVEASVFGTQTAEASTWTPTFTPIAPTKTPTPTFIPTPAQTAIDTARLPTPTNTPSLSTLTSASGGRIAFMSDRDGNHEIYVMHPDGTKQTRLTNDLAYNGEPSWAPDGTRIALAFVDVPYSKDYDWWVSWWKGIQVINLSNNELYFPVTEM